MVRPFISLWVLSTCYAASRWCEWLDRCHAPALECWAESRNQLDPKTQRMARAYRLPMRLPPPIADHETREAVFDLIRLQLKLRAIEAVDNAAMAGR